VPPVDVWAAWGNRARTPTGRHMMDISDDGEARAMRHRTFDLILTGTGLV
jgi:hypothetical protein